MPFAKRFIGAENLPTMLSEFDVQQSFCLSTDDIVAVAALIEQQRQTVEITCFLRVTLLELDRHGVYARVTAQPEPVPSRRRRRTYAAGLYTHVRDRWGLSYDQPIVLNERQAGVAVEGVDRHNRAEDRIRISLLAVDTHGVTNVAMTSAKLLGFDLCPRLRDLRERKLFVPMGWPVPETLKGVRAPGFGQGDRARAGRLGAPGGLDSRGQVVSGTCHPPPGFGCSRRSAALRCGTPPAPAAHPVSVRLPGHPGLSARDSHAAQPGRFAPPAAARYSSIHGGQVAPERGRRRQEMAAISGAHALLTNIVLAWNTSRMDGVVPRLHRDGLGIEVDWLRRIGPAHFSHINFRGTFRFNVERYADVLVERAAGGEAVKQRQ